MASGTTGRPLRCQSPWQAQEEGEWSAKMFRREVLRTRAETMRQMPEGEMLFLRCTIGISDWVADVGAGEMATQS